MRCCKYAQSSSDQPLTCFKEGLKFKLPNFHSESLKAYVHTLSLRNLCTFCNLEPKKKEVSRGMSLKNSKI